MPDQSIDMWWGCVWACPVCSYCGDLGGHRDHDDEDFRQVVAIDTLRSAAPEGSSLGVVLNDLLVALGLTDDANKP